MEFHLVVVLAILALISTEVSSLQCYQCVVNPTYEKTFQRLCSHFDHSDKYMVECPFSTMCMKQSFHLDIQNGVRIEAVQRDCAPQKLQYQNYTNGKWFSATEILEPYKEGCTRGGNKGERVTKNSYCYCRGDLCNSSPKTNHEGYTDIMGVIVVFNLMKYINSLR